jgi:hypothetical protein
MEAQGSFTHLPNAGIDTNEFSGELTSVKRLNKSEDARCRCGRLVYSLLYGTD